MSLRLVLASMAAGAMLTLAGSAVAPSASAMPIAARIAAPSPDALAPGAGSGLIEKAYWYRRHYWYHPYYHHHYWYHRHYWYHPYYHHHYWHPYYHRGWCYWHPYRCGGY